MLSPIVAVIILILVAAVVLGRRRLWQQRAKSGATPPIYVDLCDLHLVDGQIDMQITDTAGAKVIVRWHPNQAYAVSDQLVKIYATWVHDRGVSTEFA